MHEACHKPNATNSPEFPHTVAREETETMLRRPRCLKLRNRSAEGLRDIRKHEWKARQTSGARMRSSAAKSVCWLCAVARAKLLPIDRKPRHLNCSRP
jgi:hypothetical protein